LFLQACINNSIGYLIYTSTPSVVFGRQDLCGVNEDTPYPNSFLCHYAKSKAIAEQQVLAANNKNLKTVALRPHLVWGPGDTNLIPRLVDRGKKKVLKIVGDGANLVDISYIDNVVDAHLLAAENLFGTGAAAGKAYFISQGHPVNLWNWINGLYKQLEIPCIEKKVSFRKTYFAGMTLEIIYFLLRINKEPLMTRFVAEQLAKSHYFSIDAARKDFNYQPKVTTEEGVKRLIQWLNDKT